MATAQYRRPINANQQAIVGQLSQPMSYAPPNGNTGVSGGMAPPPVQAPAPAPAPAAPAPPVSSGTRLMEGDAGKLADPNHASVSPKYAFLQLANSGKYGYNQLGDMLGQLQQSHPDFYAGWTADKDKLRYTGDPSKLNSAWNGVTEVDAIGGYNSGNPQGFRWGANEPGGAGGGGLGPGGIGGDGGGVQSAFAQALMKLLNPGQASLSDPDLASQVQANKVAQQRSAERRRSAAAERIAATGGGNIDAETDNILASQGDAESAFNADLLARKNDQNRQSQLAALGSALGYRGQDLNESQFGRSIGLQKAMGEAGLNQQAILALLGGL